MKQSISLLLLCSIFACHASIPPYKAVVVVPVADLVGQPLAQQGHVDVYNLPISGVGSNGCSRLHQLIFNEVVTVLEEQANEVRISIPNIFFELKDNSNRCTEYWTHKHALASCDELEQAHIPRTIFPSPITFQENSSPENDTGTITLLFPHYDPVTKYTYSAGTRFIEAEKTKHHKVVVYAYSPKHHKACKIMLPEHMCLRKLPSTHTQKVELFASLVTQWAHQQQGFIPYVLGGCSFTATCRTDNYIKKANAYYRPTYGHTPASGLDCTGIIARAAQICGLPYYFKNTTTLIKYLEPLSAQDSIEKGNIIWFSGHAMVIADVTKNICVEARSYDHGYGKVHALPVNKLFAQTQTLEDIKDAMLTNRPLSRLDSSGKPAQTVHTIKILKMPRKWHDQQRKLS